METARRPTNRRMAALEGAAEKVARTIAVDHDIRVVVSGEMAAYQWRTKTLFIPSYASEPDDHILCAAHRGLLDHELAHVVHTDFAEAETAQERWTKEFGKETAQRVHYLWNAYEDNWIEPAYAKVYRGSRRHFEMKNEYVIAKTGGAKACDPSYVPPNGKQPIGVFGALVQSILRTAPGRGSVKWEELTPEIQALMEQLKDEIAQGLAAKNTKEAIAAGEATWRKLMETAQPPPPEGAAGEGKPGEGEGDATARGAAQKATGDQHGASSLSDNSAIAGVVIEDPNMGAEAPEQAPAAGETEAEGAGEGGEPEHRPGGAGGGGPSHVPVELAAQAIGGTWGEVQADHNVIGNAYIDEIPPQYTVHPASAARDTVVRYGPAERRDGRNKLDLLERTAGPAAKKLQSFLAGAFQASRQSMVIGGMEDGDDLDENALPGIALGHQDPSIFATTVRAVEESTFVTVLVDCSGSMDDSSPHMGPHGPEITTKSGYAAVTAMAIHKTLRSLRVPHGVLGYTTNAGAHDANSLRSDGKYMQWSRLRRSLEMHEFVPAPGIADDGSALPFITGMQWNLDGESVLWAARYAAEHGGAYDRVMLLVIADGLPAGADDGRIESAYLREVVQRVAAAQIEVYGIGVCISDWHTFSKFYPDSKGGHGKAPTGALQIRAQEGLSDSVLRELTRLLVRGYGMSRRKGRV